MNYLDELRQLARCYDPFGISKIVLDDVRFPLWAASCRVEHHHHYDGGLVKHTWEVTQLSLDMAEFFRDLGEINFTEVYLAALFHDIGKTEDYIKVGNEWTKTQHKEHIHHIAKSAIVWSKAVDNWQDFPQRIHDNVLHAILAHHGRKEWGSPVMPQTRLAWILHLCDSLSARMDDCLRRKPN